jgi:hypothetical protein
MTLHQLAIRLAGKIIRGHVIASWPDGDGFRQVEVWPSWQAPDGLIVLPPAARPYVLERIRRL